MLGGKRDKPNFVPLDVSPPLMPLKRFLAIVMLKCVSVLLHFLGRCSFLLQGFLPGFSDPLGGARNVGTGHFRFQIKEFTRLKCNLH